jgi:hypothetical protein
VTGVDMTAVKAALEMSTDDIRMVKRRVEQEHPEIGYYGFIEDPRRYGTESNDFTQFAVCLLWLRRCSHSVRFTESSYRFKHVVEADAGRYVTNGAFIQAAAALRVDYIREERGSPNALLALRVPKIVDEKTWPLLLDAQPAVRIHHRRTAAAAERSLVTPSVRARIMERDGFRCRRCGNGPEDARLVVDHVTPISAGGTSAPVNLQTLCEPCNQGKADRLPHAHDLRGLL